MGVEGGDGGDGGEVEDDGRCGSDTEILPLT